ncbi:MAG: XdhC family protein [Caulobacterales bacterium]|jgi:xanthine dehydrogenase accessory factor
MRDLHLSTPTDDWPLHGLIDDIRPALSATFDAGQNGAIATLVHVDGPSPRSPGAQMFIASDGAVAGYVSGGCVEASVALIAKDVVAENRVRRVIFGAGSPYADIKLVCGARIEIVIEPAQRGDETWRAVLDARAARQPIIRSRDGAGAPMLLTDAPPGLAGENKDGAFWRRYLPPQRLIVLGGDPVAVALARLAHASAVEVHLVRTYGPPAGPDQFGGHYRSADPASALADLKPDAWTAVVTTTHDLDADHAALRAALPSPAFYVGALGSRRRLADRIDKLQTDGLDWAAVKRLRAPVGLDIGARTPHEIAIAVLADIIAAARSARPA